MRIFLTGLMGSGKSYWGKQWAAVHKMSFLDLDNIIEEAEKKSVTEIFEQHGEEYFRNIESSALRTMIEEDQAIIACGGGTACFYNNMEWMNKNGITVYLSATPDELLKNMLNEKEKRPLLKKIKEEDLLFFIERQLQERQLFYRQAKYVLNVKELDQQSLNLIIS